MTPQTRAGEVLAEEEDGERPKYVMHNIAIADPTIMIPPGEEHHKEIAYLEFPKDAILFGAFPHAHYRGESAKVSILYPDGREELLLALPKYAFGWQREYTFAKPLKVPAGSKIVTRFTFDKSPRNPANPDPKRTMPWGDQSFDEMLYTSLRYRWLDETSADLKPAYDAQLHANQMMGVLDDDMDGKIEQAELKGRESEIIRKNFAMIDSDKDGVISRRELVAVTADQWVASDGRQLPSVRLEGSRRWNGRLAEASLVALETVDVGNGDGSRIRRDASGRQIARAVNKTEGDATQVVATGAYEQPLAGGRLRLNAQILGQRSTGDDRQGSPPASIGYDIVPSGAQRARFTRWNRRRSR